MKWAAIGLGILALIGGIVFLSTRPAEQAPAPVPPSTPDVVTLGPTVSYNEAEVEILRVEPVRPEAWEAFTSAMGSGLRVKMGPTARNETLQVVLRYGSGGAEKLDEHVVAPGGRYLRGSGHLHVLTLRRPQPPAAWGRRYPPHSN